MYHNFFHPKVMLIVLTLCLGTTLICAFQSSSFIGCIEGERQTLLKLKQSFEDPFHRLSSWKGYNCCAWKGVTCDETGHVVKLNLRAPLLVTFTVDGLESEKKLKLISGEVNSCLLELRYLEYLDLSGNHFGFSSIPQFLGSMKQLRYLNISDGSFQGTVPNNLGNLTALRVLDLSQHQSVSGFDMRWISNLSSLHHLGMASIDLSEAQNLFQVLSLLPSLSSLNLRTCLLNNSHMSLHSLNSSFLSLQSLHLGQNNFVAPLPVMLQTMTSLRVLDLSLNFIISSIDHNSFSNLKNLVHLNLAGNDFSGIENGLLSLLGNLCYLKSLDLSGNQFEGSKFGNARNLSGCVGHNLETLNLEYSRISGRIPDWFGMLKNLKHLHLQNNRFNGTIPKSLGQLSRLETLDLSYNSLEGAISEVHFAKMSKLKMLSISSNRLSINIKSNWVSPFQLEYIDMNSCKFGIKFPQWLQTQLNATTLFLSNTSISGNLPEWIEDMNLHELDLSYNQINGTLPKFPSTLERLDLSKNRITGTLPETIGDMLPGLRYLILSDNHVNGSIPNSVCNIETLETVELSKNTLSGHIPDCWRDPHQSMAALDFSSNNLSGVIPSSIGYLVSLGLLNLSNNSLEGEIPLSLKNCKDLGLLDLGQNSLSGNVPEWIGDSFPSLKILRLRENKFNGCIPFQLCQLSYDLQILDLAENNLTGEIPHCFGNFTAMVYPYVGYLEIYGNLLNWDGMHVTEVMKGAFLEYTSTIQFLINLDLSGNNLEGEIPQELTFLTGLVGLNLSHNRFSGMIPNKIGKLEWLESLDLSENQLSGVIPTSMSKLTKLSYLNMSYNNLSGQISSGGQLQTLDDPSIYAGNPLLCGASILKKCLNNEPHQVNKEDKGEHNYSAETMWFYIVIMSGFATGFWAVVGSLIFNKSWRGAYFTFVDRSKDWVHVFVALKMARIKNRIKGNHTAA